MIKFVSHFRQVGGFLRFPPTNKTDRHDITEISLKVALNTITKPKETRYCKIRCISTKFIICIFFVIITCNKKRKAVMSLSHVIKKERLLFVIDQDLSFIYVPCFSIKI